MRDKVALLNKKNTPLNSKQLKLIAVWSTAFGVISDLLCVSSGTMHSGEDFWPPLISAILTTPLSAPLRDGSRASFYHKRRPLLQFKTPARVHASHRGGVTGGAARRRAKGPIGQVSTRPSTHPGRDRRGRRGPRLTVRPKHPGNESSNRPSESERVGASQASRGHSGGPCATRRDNEALTEPGQGDASNEREEGAARKGKGNK